VEAARHVGAADEVEQGLVITEPPGPEPLPEIRVQIHGQNPVTVRSTGRT
jgi:hypothetical protein